jgi:N-acetyl-anhydromuramyl-L-alanine amidase AmpD
MVVAIALLLEVTIIDKPITFDAERVTLTIDYRKKHQDPEAKDTTIAPRMIVLHFTELSTFQGTWSYFNRTKIEASRKAIAAAGKVNVSAQFVVDRDGTIYRLMPETQMARQCIGLNHISIGVENVGDASKHKLTDAQVEADAALIRWLVQKYPITHLIGHNEADRMRGHPYWLERDPKYRNNHDDPGDQFMRKVRAKVADLKLEGPPPPAPTKPTK